MADSNPESMDVPERIEATEPVTTTTDTENLDADTAPVATDAVPPTMDDSATSKTDVVASTSDTPPDGSADAPAATSASSEPETKEADSSKFLDLAFAMDCTGSMGSYIHQAQQNIRKITEDIVAAEHADIRLALVEYRDHPPQDTSFVTQVHDFTSSVREMKSWLDGCSASGGGDTPEAVADALHQLLKLNWRENSTKICVFIADAPPHGLMASGDGFPNGCPEGLDPMIVANQLAGKGVTLYMVGCEPSITPYKEWFVAVSHITGGQYVPLKSATVLAKVITAGALEEMSLQALMDEVNSEVVQEYATAGALVDESILSTRIHSKLSSRGAVTQQLHQNRAELPKPSSEAQQLADYSSMAEVKKNFKSSPRYMNAMAAPGRSACRPPSADASSKRKSKSVSLMGRLQSAFGRKPDESEAAPLEEGASVSAPRHAEEDLYEAREDVVSDYQVSRMVNKSIQMNKLKPQTKAKKFDS